MKKRVRKLSKIRKPKRIKRLKHKPLRTKNDIGTSKVEEEFGLFLRRLGIEVEPQFKIAYKFYDFKVKDKNIVVELDGDYWHCNPEKFPNGPIDKIQRKGIKNDKFKTTLAEGNGFRILRVWENDFRTRKHEVVNKVLQFINE